jgi:phosphohistidine phosphatase
MKTVLLIRHGKSSWKNKGQKDYDRPLNRRGLTDAPLMFKVLKKRSLLPDKVWTSTANRAISTATLLFDSLDDVPISGSKDLYLAEPKQYIKHLKKTDKEKDIVALVGHNPGITELAEQLTGERFTNVPTLGIVGISFDCKKWKDLPKHGKLLFFDYPKMFK